MRMYDNYCNNCGKSQKIYTNIDCDWDMDEPMQVLEVICSECHGVIYTILADNEAFSEYLLG